MSMQATVGIARLARFKADGLEAFEATPTAFMNALAPWLAFALVGFVLMLVAGSPGEAAGDLLGAVVGLLTPPVVSHALARFWDREAGWLRFAVAFLWCQWIMPVALLAVLMASGLMMAAGLPENIAEALAGLVLLVYAVTLHGFIIRRALGVSLWRTVAMIAAINAATLVAVMAPTLLGALMGADA